ncbi:MAG: Chromosome-partitioning protein ParB [Alphaproteobacteria bacterium ADurb.Bin438]|nr:MAG: Chromosome-partitioning protein ParB [Alphaproteobacteria bacterium ADurb.Bin438]
MNDKRRMGGLGRGLSDLLGEGANASEDISELDKVKQHRFVNINLLAPSPYQPRHTFDEESLNNLVASIQEKGVLQPLLVRRDPEDNSRYEIIAGERRFRASQIAGLTELPVIVKEMNNQEVLEVALIENIQRQDLNAIEEAEGYNRLIEEFNHTQEELGKIVGKSRSHVANTMRLLTLPSGVKDLVVQGKLTAGHARALITAKNPEELAEKIVSKGLNVRQVEKLAHSEEKKKEKPVTQAEVKEDDAKALEEELSRMLGTKVAIKFKEKGGDITVTFDNLEVLDTLLKRLSNDGLLIKKSEEFEIISTDEEQENIQEEQVIEESEEEPYPLNDEQIVEDGSDMVPEEPVEEIIPKEDEQETEKDIFEKLQTKEQEYQEGMSLDEVQRLLQGEEIIEEEQK